MQQSRFCVFKRIEIKTLKRYMCSWFIPTLFTIVKVWEQPTCSLMNKWVREVWNTFFMHSTMYVFQYIRWNTTQLLKRHPVIGNNMGEPKGHYTACRCV